MKNEYKLPLFDDVLESKTVCPRCLDTTIWLDSHNGVFPCPRMMSVSHDAPNAAALLLIIAVERQRSIGNHIDPQVFDLARILTHFDAENPCKREKLETLFFEKYPDSKPNDAERKINKMNETLKKDWLLPVGSTKFQPAGHWIIVNSEELFEWRKRASSAPITQLATIHRVVKHNAPLFAGQTDFDFDINAEITAKIAEMEASK